MATPYFQLRMKRVPSTQDVARDKLDELPLLVVAAEQTEGRGRSGAEWLTADRALAASLAFHHADVEERPLSLMAGVAAVRATEGTSLKWPNDVMSGEEKVGGILVERSGDVTVIGLGLNLWWPSAPEGMGALFDEDPGEDAHAEIGALWGAELMEAIEDAGWPIDAYRDVCDTIGRDITWEPDGSGRAVDVAPDGALLVETSHGIESLHSGAVRHVR
ncbi:MAG TPA: biotin--[acetyl-CoA-carboxylase] ligase [Acidimicrobiia bacterium]|nr:biotin--[acetyl-CoA-carboxylase] ligase [Acidimicrobiia bacterium]